MGRKNRSTLAAASIGLAAVAGGLFVTGALDPVVTDVIALATPDQPEGLKAGKVADWMYYEDVPEWSSVRGVPQVARPTAPAQPGRPAIAPPEHPHRFIFSGPPPMPTYKLEPRDDCMQPHNPVSIAHNYVVKAIGNGSVSVRWWDMGDPDTQRYEVVAVPQYVNQFDYSKPRADPPKTFTTVKAAKGCKQMSTTVTNLTVGASYTFSLMGINKSPLNGRVYSITRAASEVIKIT
ncbi:hypothetical protein GCM10022223_55500 [Kineosporia mesophila]|uniref:Fibronectin type-III domain-containing protein n=1 Tax=Kineosporia mesophila TaxID=566012 RepID=A0ABP7AEB6_9ACTN|nr:hypothetical protein [Kineosporia mesophila]MCD5352853.1 hypothetical protein [Kineosporia mesophila]